MIKLHFSKPYLSCRIHCIYYDLHERSADISKRSYVPDWCRTIRFGEVNLGQMTHGERIISQNTKTLLFHENYYSLAPWLSFHSTFWAFLFFKINLDLIVVFTVNYNWQLHQRRLSPKSCKRRSLWIEAIFLGDMVVVLAIEKLQLHNCKISRSYFFPCDF